MTATYRVSDAELRLTRMTARLLKSVIDEPCLHNR